MTRARVAGTVDGLVPPVVLWRSPSLLQMMVINTHRMALIQIGQGSIISEIGGGLYGVIRWAA